MKTLVTGATGHVGANLVRALVAQGRRVRALVHSADARAIDGLDVERVYGDVRDGSAMRRALCGVDVVYHLAAIISIDGDRDGAVKDVNVRGAHNVARIALEAGVRRMVHVSSIHAFDPHPLDRPLDETRAWATGRHPAYDRSKAEGEAAVRRVVDAGLDAVIVNPTSVVGPYDFRRSRMGRFFLDLYRRRLPALPRGGFDWVDARDVAHGLIAAETYGRRGEGYLLGGHYLSMVALARLAEQVTGVRAPRQILPMTLLRFLAPFATVAAHLQGADPLLTRESLRALRGNPVVRYDKSAAELGYRPRHICETVDAIYRWFESAGALRPALRTRRARWLADPGAAHAAEPQVSGIAVP
jgi:dihydroflavonol-4-reductase